MEEGDHKDIWAVGDSYDQFMGRWSALAARELIDWLGLPDGLRWVDVGCGTGALTASVLEQANPESVVGVDPSRGFLALAEERVSDSRVRFVKGDAQALPLADAEYDVVVSGLMLNFVPDPVTALREMQRVVRPGGTVALYVWDYAEKMQLIRYFWDAAKNLDPAADSLDEGKRAPICKPKPLTGLFHSAGLQSVRIQLIDVPTSFATFDEFWSPFLGGQGPAPAYCMSLSESQRRKLEHKLEVDLPISPNGSIQLIARAWAVRGMVPA